MPTRSLFLLFPRLAILTSLFLLSNPINPSLAGTYRDSAHGGNSVAGKGAVRLPGTSPGNCAHCHEQHASISGVTGVQPPPDIPGPSNYLLFNNLSSSTENIFCDYCHSSTAPTPNGADNIASQVAKAHKHNPSSIPPVLCNNCHDSHVAQKTTHLEAQNGNTIAAGSPLLSVAGVSVAWSSPGSPVAGSENLSNGTPSPLDPVTLEYQLCLKCHGGQLAAVDLRVDGQFNPNNYSVHPVTTTGNNWKNAYLRDTVPSPLVFPWSDNKNAKMYCSDCHGSNLSTDPVGPHGSTNASMLKLAGPSTTLDNLCLKCHVDPALGSAWNNASSRDHRLPAHQSTATNIAGTNNTYGCLACHGDIADPGRVSNIHGTNFVGTNNGPGTTGRPSTAFLVSRLITKNYYTTASGNVPGARFCEATCHASDGTTGYAY